MEQHKQLGDGRSGMQTHYGTLWWVTFLLPSWASGKHGRMEKIPFTCFCSLSLVSVPLLTREKCNSGALRRGKSQNTGLGRAKDNSEAWTRRHVTLSNFLLPYTAHKRPWYSSQSVQTREGEGAGRVCTVTRVGGIAIKAGNHYYRPQLPQKT